MTASDSRTPLSVYAIVPMEPGIFEAVEAIVASVRMRMIGEKPFAAVVGHAVETAGQGREVLMPLLLAHQRLVERILAVSPVLPVRFGTQVAEEDDVHAMLVSGGPEIAAAFDRVAGCVQMEVVAKWDAAAILSEIAKEDVIVALKRQWMERPDEALRLAIGDRVKQALEARRTGLANSLLGSLRTLAGDAIAYPPTDDRIVLQVALLVPTADLDALDELLEELDATHGGRISFRLIGPLAPCCFATIEMEMIAPTALDDAMHLLAVAPGASPADLRQAYHRAVKGVHPDLTGPNATGPSLEQLSEAYRVLSLCAGAVHSEAHRTIVVAAKRQEPAYDAAA